MTSRSLCVGLHYVHNYVGAEEFHIESSGNIPEDEAIRHYSISGNLVCKVIPLSHR
jgi:hypothetical protein